MLVAMTIAATLPASGTEPGPPPVPVLDVVVPVYNEEVNLEPGVRRLHAHLAATFPYPFRITVADNASTDGTLAVARWLAAELPEVGVLHLAAKGRGGALRAAWSASDAPVVPAGLARQLVRFIGVGIASTVAYLVLFLVLRTGLAAQPANLVALLLTALGNTAVNRRFTFGVTGRAGYTRHQAQGLVAFVAGLALTSGALALLPAATGRPVELAVLVLANLAATLLRFLLLRAWVFRTIDA